MRTFYENSLPNKGKHLTKKSWRIDGFQVFFIPKVFIPTHSGTVIKGFNWIITKWPENAIAFVLESNTSKLTSKHTVHQFWSHNKQSSQYLQRIMIISTNQTRRPSPKSRHFADNIFICIKIFLIKIVTLVFRFDLHSFVSHVKLAIRP